MNKDIKNKKTRNNPKKNNENNFEFSSEISQVKKIESILGDRLKNRKRNLPS